MLTVSIVTITQYSRFNSLQILHQIIKLQDYQNIKEWVIVEGSPSTELRSKNITNINTLIRNNENLQNPLKIRLIVPKEIIPLSDLRNLGNDHCVGDVIVCMDDDDYYPTGYVSNIADKFQRYDRLITGCSAIYMYDFFADKLYKFKGFHQNHTTNNCMAYRKQYLENHRYKEGLNHAEEYAFTNGFTELMIQLKPETGVVVSLHDANTVDKSAFIESNDVVLVDDVKIGEIIPAEIFAQMKRAFTLQNV
jgi:glycosyltransferase involved in cell wall biosynthesis